MNLSELVKVGDSLERIPRQAKVMKSAYQADGAFPVIDQGKDYIAGYTDDPDLRYNGPLPLTVFGDHTRILKWVDRPFAVGADGTQLLRGNERFDQRYFYYALCTLQLEHFGYERHFKYLKEEEIPCPDLPTQRRIAGILSAYDDLIENNLRRIRILEEMAQSLYREWFVHFRFPGHESIPLVDSPLGAIPEGWEVKPLFEVATVKYGKMLPKKDLKPDGEYPVYGAAKVIGHYDRFTREDRTIICGCRGSVGEMQITEPRCYVTNNSFTFDPVAPEFYFWLFYALTERGLRDVTGGAAQPQITLDGISQVTLAVPDIEVLQAFEARAWGFANLLWNLKSRNQILRQTCDLLLPKLLNGG